MTSEVVENKKGVAESKKTAWFAVLVLYVGGCTTSLHIGKIPPAIPLFKSEWGLSLTESGLIVSLYSLLIALCGFALGLFIRRMGSAQCAFIAVGIVGIGGLIGSFATALPLLLVGRTIEGLGWIMSVIVLPSLISALSSDKDRPMLLAAWASFLPVGAGSMLLMAPALLERGGWQLTWHYAALMSFLASGCVFLVTRRYRERLRELGPTKEKNSYGDLRKPVVWMLSLCFFAYSFSYVPLISFFPLLILETSALSLETVSLFAALILLCNSVGSVSSGFLLRRGVGFGPLLIVGILGGGVFAYLHFATGSSTSVRIASAFLFSMLGGMVPGVLFSTIPRAASQPASAGMLFGVMMQFSGIGMLLGGVILPGVVEWQGQWSSAGVAILAVACMGVVLAWQCRRHFEAGKY